MSSEGILRAMARSYANGHSWDHLDGEACIKAADELCRLRTELEGTRSVIIQHAIGMLNQIGLSGAEADEIVKRGV